MLEGYRGMNLDLEFYRNLLREEKDKLKKKMTEDQIGGKGNLKDSTRELSLYDNHPADLSSENFEASRDLALHRHEGVKYKEIMAALARIDQGEYGFCQGCHEEIDPRRLRQIPEAPYCLGCQRTKEKEAPESSRPMEERVLRERGSHDGASYDREDAWQDVARYNKLPHVPYEDVGEDEEEEGSVEPTDMLSNEDLKKQLE